MNNNKPENKVFEHSLKEKINKYGDPRRNLLITILVIIFFGALIIIQQEKDLGITANYTRFYPDSTQLYIDAKLTEKNISLINKSTNLHISNLSDLLNRILCSKNNDKTRLQINQLMAETFANSFSFGTWIDVEKKYQVYRSLAIFPIEKKGKIDTLFKYLFSKNAKLTSSVFQGYKITYSLNSKGAYLISRNNLFIADSYQTLTYIVEKHILKNSHNLYTLHSVRKAIGYLDEKRLGTIIINNIGPSFSKLNNIINEKYLTQIRKFNDFIKPMNTTAIAVLMDKQIVYFKSYTPIDLSKVEDKHVKHAFESAFKTINENINENICQRNAAPYVY